RLDPGRGHPLTGPIAVAGARPGDVLEVDVLEVRPAPRGFTLVLPEYAALSAHGVEPLVVHWEIGPDVARSPQLPGVAVPVAPFIGTLGVAPSHAQVAAFARREAALAAERGVELPGPRADGAVPVAAAGGLHTIPPRETGGNADVRSWGAGTRVLLPVAVPEALLSAGDAHAAQGDGESAGTALEADATVRLRIGLRRVADGGWRPSAPAWERRAPEPPVAPRPCFATTGISVDGDGRNHLLDATLAARRALDDLVGWLVAERGLGPAQAMALVSVAADLRIASLVNRPNAVVTAVLPLDVFEP
ncbi:MAG TPA: acetamidase/formamidase family protein, partial [Capillimicrobium sp.]